MAPVNKKKLAIEMSRQKDSNHHQNENTSMSIDYSSSDSNSGGSSCEGSMSPMMGDSMSGRQYARVNRMVLDKESEEYKRRRARNNLAVKKSRTKSKLKTIQTLERVNQLKAENDELQQKIDILSKELRLLKDLFMAHASNAHGTEITELDLKLLTSSEMEHIPQQLPRGLGATRRDVMGGYTD